MQSITFTCKTTTPMFLAGADGRTPELRPPSIKGSMRFWWRAMNGHLLLEELKRQEGQIFGDTTQRSKVIIRCSSQPLQTKVSLLVPHKERMKQKSMANGQVFRVTLNLIPPYVFFDLEKLIALFELTCVLGGLGKRVRRGMGSIELIDYQIKDGASSKYTSISTEWIAERLKVLSPHYVHKTAGVFNTYQGRTVLYPWIKSAELGPVYNSTEELLKKISHTTHKIKEQNPRAYEPSLGHASRGRFASPIYVSVYGNRPVITTLRAVPNQGYANKQIQDTFKQTILNSSKDHTSSL